LGVYIYSNNNDVMPRRIFIWIDKIAEIAKEMTTTKGKTDVTDNINALFSFVLYHEFGHAVMDIKLYGVKPSQNFSYNKDVPYRYIEEICADSFALRCMEEDNYSKKQQSFIEDFIKSYNFEPLIIQRVSKWIGHWMCIKVLFDYDIAKRIENSWEVIREGFIDFGYIKSVGMKGWIVKVYRHNRLCIMDTYSRKLFDIPESNDGTYTVEYIFHYMKESSM
ncbi:MAG: hypothetical protein KBT27_00420, partial [Prevotellaceae bacterium]|nr:hypothetical protein [Candidatus Faecinaster equi]